MLLTTGIVYSKDIENRIEGKYIIIDPGHGGKDSGTSVGNILEKNINLSIAIKLKEKLNKHDVDVLLTRDGDYDLSSPNVNRRKKSDFDNRIRLINNSNADMYLSIHINYLDDNRYYGAQTFYTEGNEGIAKTIQEEFNNNLNSPLEEKKLNDEDLQAAFSLIINEILLQQIHTLLVAMDGGEWISEKYRFDLV